jgi:hypothetical protein
MNRIKDAFDNIKVSNNLKERTYQKIINNKKYSTKFHIIMSLSCALTCLLFGIFVYNYNGHKLDNNKENVLTVKNVKNDSFIYHKNIYLFDHITSDKDVLGKKLGSLKVVESNPTNDFESYYHNKASLYKIKGSLNDNELAVLDNNEISIYKIDNR